jgi:hypothetical protein
MTTNKPKKLHKHSALIDDLGGPTELARFFDIKPPSVCGWRESGIPGNRMLVLLKRWPKKVKPYLTSSR